MRGSNPPILQEILGHASITTTLDLYPGKMDRYVDRLNEAPRMSDVADDELLVESVFGVLAGLAGAVEGNDDSEDSDTAGNDRPSTWGLMNGT
jgi:hypothetical protein